MVSERGLGIFNFWVIGVVSSLSSGITSLSLRGVRSVLVLLRLKLSGTEFSSMFPVMF